MGDVHHGNFETPPRISATVWGGTLALVGWFIGLTVVCAGLLSRHLLALPVPSADGAFGRALATLRAPNRDSTWLAVHALSGDCRCSRAIADHLVATARPEGWSEIVLWVGDAAPPEALLRRFDVRRVGSSTLARLHIEAVPLLVVVDPLDRVRYAGGYTDRKQGAAIHDVDILMATRDRVATRTLPLFGCATSERLRSALSLASVTR